MQNHVFITNRYKQIKLNTNDVCYVERENRKVFVYTKDQSYWEYCSMDEMLGRINNRNICRCHRSLAVNLDYIESLESNNVNLVGGKTLIMCRAARQQTKRMWARYKLGAKINTRTGTDRRKGEDRRISAERNMAT